MGYGKVIPKSLTRQYFVKANLFYKAAHLRGYTFAKEGYISVLQVKIKFRSNFSKPGLILYFLSLQALIIQELGLETKETENQPRLKNF